MLDKLPWSSDRVPTTQLDGPHCDAGALIGFERGNRTVIAFLETAQREHVPVRTTAAAVAQAWRSGARQARLIRLLRGVQPASTSRSFP
jgi:hypothetical protein